MTLFIPSVLTTQLPTMTTITTTIRQLLQRDYGPDLERACRGLAIAIAFTYACGYAFGSWLHQTNNQLSGFARQFSQPDWHQQRLADFKARLAVRRTPIGDPQPALPLTGDPQAPAAAKPAVVVRTKRSKLPQPAPKASRQRRPKNASRTSAPATA